MIPINGDIIKPPLRRLARTDGRHLTGFLAGSIEMGASEDWQNTSGEKLKRNLVLVYNPRRDGWDPSWEQDINHVEFNVQVHWELDMIDEADVVIFYFHPDTKAPVSLLELGLVLGTKPADTIFVCCPTGYWRKGNVDITCERFGVKVYETMQELHTAVERYACLVYSGG